MEDQIIKKSIVRLVEKSSFLRKETWNLLETSYKDSYKKGGEGESKFLDIFSKFCDAPVVIDVGVNKGKWSEQLKLVMPRSTIYTIEPIPSFFSQINEDIVREKYNLALSEKCGSLKSTNLDWEESHLRIKVIKSL